MNHSLQNNLIYNFVISIYKKIQRAVISKLSYDDVFEKYIYVGYEGLNPFERIVIAEHTSEFGLLIPEKLNKNIWSNACTQTVMYPEAEEIIIDESEDRYTVYDNDGEIISTIPIHVLLSTIESSVTSLSDVSFNITAEINECFSEALAISADTLAVSGDGMGKILGITKDTKSKKTIVTIEGEFSPAVFDAMRETLKEMVAEEDFEKLIEKPNAPKDIADKYRHLCWIMNSNTGLTLSIHKDHDNRYVIDPQNENVQSVGLPDDLFGIRINYNEWADDFSTDTESYPIILADLKKYAFIKHKSMHISRKEIRELDRVEFILRVRLSGGIIDYSGFKSIRIKSEQSNEQTDYKKTDQKEVA